MQIPVVERVENIGEPGEGRSRERAQDGVRDELGEAVHVVAEKRGERQVHGQIAPRGLGKRLARDVREVQHALAVELRERLLGLVVLARHVVVRRGDGRVGAGHRVQRALAVGALDGCARFGGAPLVHAQQRDVHAQVQHGLLAPGLLVLDELLDDVAHERARGGAVGVPRGDRHRQVAELERRDLVLEVHDEVVVELHEPVAALEVGHRHDLLQLHRELVPELAVVQIAESVVLRRQGGRPRGLRREPGLHRGGHDDVSVPFRRDARKRIRSERACCS